MNNRFLTVIKLFCLFFDFFLNSFKESVDLTDYFVTVLRYTDRRFHYFEDPINICECGLINTDPLCIIDFTGTTNCIGQNDAAAEFTLL